MTNNGDVTITNFQFSNNYDNVLKMYTIVLYSVRFDVILLIRGSNQQSIPRPIFALATVELA